MYVQIPHLYLHFPARPTTCSIYCCILPRGKPSPFPMQSLQMQFPLLLVFPTFSLTVPKIYFPKTHFIISTAPWDVPWGTTLYPSFLCWGPFKLIGFLCRFASPRSQILPVSQELQVLVQVPWASLLATSGYMKNGFPFTPFYRRNGSFVQH